MLIVQKYGGSSVADKDKVFNVAGRIAAAHRENNDIVIVVSAQGNTTDELIARARDISKNASKRELDMLVSTGEQQSAAIMAIALQDLGVQAVSLTASQAGILSTMDYGDAEIIDIQTGRIKEELNNGKIVIIAGFQGINEAGDISTLGRGASDTTAIALASVLGADSCEIYTDVEGVFTADPRIIEDAKKHKEICYDEMLEMASMGARVLHNRSIELAEKFNVVFDVKSSLTEGEPTRVSRGQVIGLERKVVKGITADSNVCKITVNGIKTGNSSRILSMLAKYKPDVIVLSTNVDNSENLSFSASKADFTRIVNLLEDNGLTIHKHENLAKLSIIGMGAAYDPKIAAALYDSLCGEGINIYLASASEIRLSVLIDVENKNRAIVAAHKGLKPYIH